MNVFFLKQMYFSVILWQGVAGTPKIYKNVNYETFHDFVACFSRLGLLFVLIDVPI